ncbi:acyl-CoA thioesterase 9.1 [Aphelenchoides avenae]|nr:acyl-CoA thioesterase 9.1 [Aphelenchus avenae]
MDGMTTNVGYKHIQDPRIPITAPNSDTGHHKVAVVTAGYRRIDSPTEAVFQTDRNVVVTGFVSWTSRSSMEIIVDAQQKDDETGAMKDPIFVGKFVCTTISPDYKAAPCVPLKVVTPEDRLLFEMGEKERMIQENRRNTTSTRIAPSEEEVALLRSLQLHSIDPISLRATKMPPANHVPMSDLYIGTTDICMPTEVSAQLKLFGGFQLRTAYEAAYHLVDDFLGGKPLKFLCTSNGSFLRPVDLGSKIYRDAQICFTDGRHIQVYVSSYILDAKTKAKQTVNKFNFTFEAGEDVPAVVPNTFDETLRFLHARRELQYALNPVTV